MAGHRLGAWEGGGGYPPPAPNVCPKSPFQCIPPPPNEGHLSHGLPVLPPADPQTENEKLVQKLKDVETIEANHKEAMKGLRERVHVLQAKTVEGKAPSGGQDQATQTDAFEPESSRAPQRPVEAGPGGAAAPAAGAGPDATAAEPAGAGQQGPAAEAVGAGQEGAGARTGGADEAEGAAGAGGAAAQQSASAAGAQVEGAGQAVGDGAALSASARQTEAQGAASALQAKLEEAQGALQSLQHRSRQDQMKIEELELQLQKAMERHNLSQAGAGWGALLWHGDAAPALQPSPPPVLNGAPQWTEPLDLKQPAHKRTEPLYRTRPFSRHSVSLWIVVWTEE